MRTTLIAALLAMAFAGCSSAGKSRQAEERVVVDTDKVVAIEKAARDTGTEVHWVNPPRKRVR